MSVDNPNEQRARAGRFATTHWSVVLEAGQSGSPRALEALAQLCQTYWYPLYVYVRRHGYSAHDAQDLTQEFFARLLEKNYLSAVDRKKGKFRSFLLASLEHFLAKEWARAHRQKRGGGCTILFLDHEMAENRYRVEPAHDLTAEKIYERRWAMTVLEQALVRLGEEFIAADKARLFDRLKIFLTGERGELPYAEVAAQLSMTEGAVKVAVHRLRQRYGELLRAEIAHTVASPDQVDEEIRFLLAALRG